MASGKSASAGAVAGPGPGTSGSRPQSVRPSPTATPCSSPTPLVNQGRSRWSRTTRPSWLTVTDVSVAVTVRWKAGTAAVTAGGAGGADAGTSTENRRPDSASSDRRLTGRGTNSTRQAVPGGAAAV